MIANSSSVSWGVRTAVRLVEDEQVRLLVERLDDLHALADPDRKVLDQGVGVHVEAVALGDLHDPGPGRALSRTISGPRVDSTPSMTFSVTVNTGTSMKCWWTIPIPALIASPGSRKATGEPSTRISPSSWRYRP